MIRLSEWNPAESDSLPQPGASDVHVWRIDASVLPQRLVLSGDEQARADRFLNKAARTQFVTCRTALRTILARYLSADPADL
ncbi:MAG TPA: hypothetical protein VN541_00840, partial [Tepidisphaeraceae bacterium]|nr:hypothetical protein [Tepidisphaeraceae bacterium]